MTVFAQRARRAGSFFVSFQAVALLALSNWASPALAAPTPASGEVKPSQLTQSFTGAFVVDNPAGVCRPQTCDYYNLTLTLPANYDSTNPAARLIIDVTGPTGAGDDFNVELRDGSTVVASGTSSGDEHLDVPAGKGSKAYVVRVIPNFTLGDSYSATVTLKTGDAGSGSSSGGSSSSSSSSSSGGSSSSSSGGSGSSSGAVDPTAPRFTVYPPPAGVSTNFGEPSIGYNEKTGHAMVLGGGDPTFKITFPDHSSRNQPQACDAKWDNVTFAYADGGTPPTLDPILASDQTTGRTFISQLAGATHRFAYTDDDGANWSVGVGTPNGATDHQTIGSGPYPAGVTIPHPTSNIAIYYCSQQQYATCNRSDDGGASFGAPVVAYNNFVDGCGNFHGHIKVAPDGTVYLPNAGCGTQQAAVVSEDAGQSFVVRKVTPSTSVAGAYDPSIGVASDNTAYFCRTDADGHIRVGVTADRGKTWINDFDVGNAFGLKNGAFPQAVAGDGNRAACAFLGTTEPGNYQAADYKGVWYAYIATTYDKGKTWTTVNVTPNDPVQGAGGICISGTGCTGNNRNLLDFNEITQDEKGRPVFVYADGCTGACVSNPSTANNFSSEGRVIRQTGGKTLRAAFDAEVRQKPDGACLAGFRDNTASNLTWKKPADRGEAAVASYSVYRGTTPDNLSVIASNVSRESYVDPVGNSVAQYYYAVTASNSFGEGLNSNKLPLNIGVAPVVETTCKLPGLTVVVDPAGDEKAVDPSIDIRSISIGEPQAFDGKLIVTLKVGSLATLPPNQLYAVRLRPPTVPAGSQDYWVGMNTAGGTPSYVYGTTSLAETPAVPVAGSAGAVVFNYIGALDAASVYKADGTIALVISRSLVGNVKPGDLINGVTGSIRASSNATAPTAGSAVDTTSDGSYAVRAVDACFVNTLPIASLVASKLTGNAPLIVDFDASGSRDTDAGDAITSYSFNFGDGSAVVTQATPTISHSYQSAGIFNPAVTVTDKHSGTALASQRIEVKEVVNNAVTPFSFIERTNVPVKTFITSESVTLAGFSGSLPISISSGGQYSIDGGAFTNAAGSVIAGAKLGVRHVSASAESTSVVSTVMVGAYNTPFKSTTTTVDRVPDAFDFGTKSGMEPGAVVESAVITPSAYDVASIVAGPDVEYRINGGSYTKANGTLSKGQTVQVRHTSNAAHLGYTKTYLKVGGVTGYFTTRTK